MSRASELRWNIAAVIALQFFVLWIPANTPAWLVVPAVLFVAVGCFVCIRDVNRITTGGEK